MGLHIGSAVSKLIAGLGLSKKDKTQGTEKANQVFANNMSDPIGDTVTFSNKQKDTVTVEDLIALVDDASIDKSKLNRYTKEKPVATLGTLSNLTNTSIPEDLKQMTEMTGKPGVKFYNDKAFADGSAKRIGAGTEELMDSGINPEAFYNALQS